jgi:hypothetical protein
MPVSAPVREMSFEEALETNDLSELELKAKLLRVVDSGHRQVLQGKTVDANRVTVDIRMKLGLAS